MRLISLTLITLLLFTSCKEVDEEISFPIVQTGSVVDVSATGVTFHGKIQNQGPNDLIDHGFVWDTDDNPKIASSYQKSLGKKVDINFTTLIESALVKDSTYYLRAYIADRNKVTYGRTVSFQSKGSLRIQVNDFYPKLATWNDTIAIEGKNFSPKMTDIKVRFGERMAEVIESTDSLIHVIVPDTLNTAEMTISVQSLNQIERHFPKFRLLPPSLEQVLPASGNYNDLVTIEGNYFRPEFTQLSFDTIAVDIISITTKELIAKVPTGLIGGTVSIEVAVLDQKVSTAFYCKAPRIISTSKRSATWGDEIIMEGLNFSNTLSGNKVFFGDEPAEILEASDTILKVRVPNSLLIQSTPISIEVNEQISIYQEIFQLISPSIIDFSPKNGTFDDIIELTGNYFHPEKILNSVFFESIEVDIIEITPTKIRFSVPKDYFSENGRNNITLKVGALSTQSDQEFELDLHQIISFSPIKVYSGELINIIGSNFNPNYYANTVYLGDLPADIGPEPTTNIRSASTTALEVQTSSLIQGGSYSIKLGVAGRTVVSSSNIEILQPWKRLGDFPDPGTFFGCAFSIGNKGYVGNFHSGKEFWEYNPVNDDWIKKADLPLRPTTSFSVLNKGYVITSTILTKELFEYDPEKNSWENKGVFPGEKTTYFWEWCSFVVGDLAYIITGIVNSQNPDALAEIWEYNPKNNSWVKKRDFPYGDIPNSNGFSIDDKGYLITNGNLYEYDPDSDNWNIKLSIENKKFTSKFAPFVLGSKAYIPISDNQEKFLYEYTPATNSLKQLLAFPNLDRSYPSGFSIGQKGYFGLGTYSYVNYIGWPARLDRKDFHVFDPSQLKD